MPTSVDTAEVRALVENGAQLVDVLPHETFRHEHLPNAISLPLAEIDSAPQVLDAQRPVITYCYDAQCDLSSRAAARLEQLGFATVYDYVKSKVAWLAEGLPGDGILRDAERALARARRDVPTLAYDATIEKLGGAIGDWPFVVVVDDHDIVLGLVRREASSLDAETPVRTAMQPAPPTVRPSIPRRELAASMDDGGEQHVLVTTAEGRLLGAVFRNDLEVL